MYLPWRSHLLLQSQSATHGVRDKPQMYIFMPYSFTEFQIIVCVVRISACFS